MNSSFLILFGRLFLEEQFQDHLFRLFLFTLAPFYQDFAGDTVNHLEMNFPLDHFQIQNVEIHRTHFGLVELGLDCEKVVEGDVVEKAVLLQLPIAVQELMQENLSL